MCIDRQGTAGEAGLVAGQFPQDRRGLRVHGQALQAFVKRKSVQVSGGVLAFSGRKAGRQFASGPGAAPARKANNPARGLHAGDLAY